MYEPAQSPPRPNIVVDAGDPRSGVEWMLGDERAEGHVTPVYEAGSVSADVGNLAECEMTDSLILVVDDDPLIADAMSMLLSLEGFEVLVAACEREALDRLSGRRPDLVISDYRLCNGETGAGVIRAVRAELGAQIPAIVVSGGVSDAVALEDLDHSGFMNKPADTSQLLAEVRRRIRGGEPDQRQMPPARCSEEQGRPAARTLGATMRRGSGSR